MRMLFTRLRFVLRRIFRWDPSRLIEQADRTKHLTKRPRWVLMLDMIWWATFHEVTFENYMQWDFPLLNARERKTWVTDAKSAIISNRYNSQIERVRFDDKVRFAETFGDVLGRELIDVLATDADELRAFITRHGAVLSKDPVGSGGKGITKRVAAEIDDYAALRDELIAARETLIEEILPQHDGMNALTPRTVNTLRMITYLDPQGEVHLLTACLKMGNTEAIDNFSGGGLHTMLDEHGVALHAASDQVNDIYETHPVTGTRIEGFQVPCYDEVLTMLDDLARRVPEMPYIGWDIAITPSGPAVIEGNHNTGAFQSRPVTSGRRTGDLPKYREVIGF